MQLCVRLGFGSAECGAVKSVGVRVGGEGRLRARRFVTTRRRRDLARHGARVVLSALARRVGRLVREADEPGGGDSDAHAEHDELRQFHGGELAKDKAARGGGEEDQEGEVEGDRERRVRRGEVCVEQPKVQRRAHREHAAAAQEHAHRRGQLAQRRGDQLEHHARDGAARRRRVRRGEARTEGRGCSILIRRLVAGSACIPVEQLHACDAQRQHGEDDRDGLRERRRQRREAARAIGVWPKR
eukprot:6178816-Pleurochrysis_carterae.AAC.2